MPACVPAAIQIWSTWGALSRLPGARAEFPLHTFGGRGPHAFLATAAGAPPCPTSQEVLTCLAHLTLHNGTKELKYSSKHSCRRARRSSAGRVSCRCKGLADLQLMRPSCLCRHECISSHGGGLRAASLDGQWRHFRHWPAAACAAVLPIKPLSAGCASS